MSQGSVSLACMATPKVRTAAEMELMTPDERAQLVLDGQTDSLDDLDPDFRARVDAKSRRIAEEHGLLDTESS